MFFGLGRKAQEAESAAVLQLTEENFEQEVLRSERPVLVDFWASWCGPCRMMSPVVGALAEENPAYKVGKINVDEQRALATQFGVSTIPTLMVFRDGHAVRQSVGVQSKERLLSLLQ